MAWTGCVCGGITAAFVSLFLLIVGFSIPFWISFEKDETSPEKYNIYVGVWYLMVCNKGESGSCKSAAIEPDFTKGFASVNLEIPSKTNQEAADEVANFLGVFQYWWAIQIVSTIGLGLVLLACLILLCCRCAGIHSKGFFLIAALLFNCGGACALAIAIVLAYALAETITIADFKVTGETFPWSALLFGLGGVLGLLTAVLLYIIFCKWDEYGKYYSSEEDEKYLQDNQQMSNLSKSYDRTRHPYNAGSRHDYQSDYQGRNRDFAQSKKYREYDDRDRGYGGNQNRGYEPGYGDRGDRGDRGYERERGYYDQDRGYEQGPSRSYERSYNDRGGYNGTAQNYYSQPRSGDNMYRPYNQYRY